MPLPAPPLELLLAIPLLAMVACRLARTARQAFLVGVAGAGLQLLAVMALLWRFLPEAAGEPTIEPFPAGYLGVDGIAILFVALTALLTLLVILYGEIVHERPAGLYGASVFAFQAVLTGVFLSTDLLGFWLGCLLELIPAGFILDRWGLAHSRRRALRQYLQGMALGLGLMLAAVLMLGWNHAEQAGHWSFRLADLLGTPLSADRQPLVFALLFFGLAVRLGLFPFHAWLPAVAQHGPLATLCVYLVGLKVGIYALLRFVLPLLPEAVHQWRRPVVVLAVGGMFYGALLALMQINLRRLLAFAAVSHSAMLVVGVFCLNSAGLQGSLMLAINFGAAAAGLLFATGVLYRSTGTALLPRLGGMFDALPLLGLTFLIAALSTMAMPGTPGFDAAHLILEGAIQAHHWTLAVAVATGSVAAAGFLLWAFQRAFLARRRDRSLQPRTIRLSIPEIALAGILCSVMLAVGFYSKPWLAIADAPLTDLARRLARPAAVALDEPGRLR